MMVSVSFRLSISGRCCLDGSSIHQPIFCCSSYSPQSSPPQCDHIILTISLVFLCLFGIAGPTFPSSINFFNGWFRLHVRNYLFCLFNKVPDLTTAMDWFVVCFVHETQHISRYHLFSNAFMCFSVFFVQGPRFTSMWQLKICTFMMRFLFFYLLLSLVSPCL